jgi:hypothetical protein
MDYTDLTRVKQAMDSQESAADLILSDYITRASRLIDLLVTGVPGVADYFKSETIANEVLSNGVIDYAGRLMVYPHKPVVTAVTALSYRYSLANAYVDANIAMVVPEYEGILFEGYLSYAERIYVKASYTGGFATTVSGLPQDIVELGTLMAVRLYKEARSGLGDSIGVAELGTLTYTKALPSRAREIVNLYARTAAWI